MAGSSSSRWPATSSSPATRDGIEALGLHRRRPLGLHRPRRGPRDQARRPGRPAPRPRRHGLEHPQHLRQPDRPVRPLPRPQVRPGLAGGLLQPPGRLRRPRPRRSHLRRRPRRRRAASRLADPASRPGARDRDRILAIAKDRAGEPLAELDRRIAEAEAVQDVRARAVTGLRLSQRPVDHPRRDPLGPGRPRPDRSRSPGSCSTPATTTSTRSARASASPLGSRSRRRTTPTFGSGVSIVADRTGEDFANPRLSAGRASTRRASPARYVRVTATRLAPRQNDYNFALAEVEVFDPAGINVARSGKVSALDSIEAPPRWRPANLVDGDYPVGDPGEIPARSRRARETLIRESLDEAGRRCARRGDPIARRGRSPARRVAPAARGLRRDDPPRLGGRSEGPGPTAASLG